MKNKIILPLIVFIMGVSYTSCSDFVEDVNPLIDQVSDELLNDPSQAIFLLRGVKGNLWRLWSGERPGTELHGDTATWDSRISDSVFTESWNQVTGSFNPRAYNGKFARPHELRFQALEMLRRIEIMGAGNIDSALLSDMKFWANFMLGYSHHILATWYGLNAQGTSAGNILSPDPDTGADFGTFRSYTDILGKAIAFYTAALSFSAASGDGIVDAAHGRKVVNSFIARAHIDGHSGGYGGNTTGNNSAAAAAAAANGLQKGDQPFALQVTEGFENTIWDSNGRGNQSTSGFGSGPATAARFARYILADPKEGEILNNQRPEDVAASLAFMTPAVIDRSLAAQASADFPVYDLSAGFSLSWFPTGPASTEGNIVTNVYGAQVPVTFEGGSNGRGHFLADNPRGLVNTRLGLTGDQTPRIMLFEMLVGEAQLNTYKTTGQWLYAETRQLHGSDLASVYRTDKYPNRTSPFVLIDWQETNLIKAEVAIAGGAGDAVALINEVRDSHGLDAVDQAFMDAYDRPWGGTYGLVDGALGFLIEERDKELMFRSTRLYDQFRFGIFHLKLGDDWVYFPMSQNELDANPNVNDLDTGI
jgi:hypothetical protein